MPINKIGMKSYKPIDLQRNMIDRVSNRISQVTMIDTKDFFNGKNIMKIDFENNIMDRLPKIKTASFDIIETFGVLDKLTRPDLNMAFIDLARILTPKGWLVNVYEPTDKVIFTRDCHQVFFTYALDEDFSLFRRK